MKNLISTLCLSFVAITSVHAAGLAGQCVFPETSTAKNGNLQFKKPVYIYATPTETSDKVLLASLNGYTVVKESNGFIQLKETAGFNDANPNAGRILGWAKRSGFRIQELRNCS
ncbi:hypothetical protein DXT88_06150 [Herbaspirillum lusitanum]|uniref:hypothetical protein n=1 Tax=Herbaspirillum lusitanum TaxID=213312 RepID=UPI002238C40C|nr:hypothetical protein [Herbaspirillum lusitanum]MCW5297754.1 hypothetical protein [Herbaspirillum lusitanum]